MTRKLLCVVGALLIAVAATASTSYSGGSTSQKNATALIDHLYAAVNAHNANAIGALLTPDVIYFDGNTTVGADKISSDIATEGGYYERRIAPVSVSGNYATTFVDAKYILKPGLDVFQIKDGKIHRWWEFEFGTTKPFDNADWRT